MSVRAQVSPAGAFDGQPRVVERGPHHNVIEFVAARRDTAGQTRAVTHRYVQLETGLNYPDARGGWQPSGTELELRDGRAVYGQGQFHAAFAANVADPVAVTLRTPEGLVLKSRIFGLAYFDPESGQSVLIAELQDAAGLLLPEKHAILYPDAFRDVAADVRLSVTRAGFEQDVILRQQPPPPETFGLGPKSELQLLTEFFDPPTPREHAEGGGLARTNQLTTAAGPRVDPRLTFGTMSFGKGRAFRLEDSADAVPVRKTWERLEGRQFLIEAVPYEQWRSQLETLPKAAGFRSALATPDLRDHLRSAPRRTVAAKATPELRLAQAIPARPGVVLDYVLTLVSQSDLTLAADTTYYVTGPVILTGVTTIEGGTVVKYANNGPYLRIQGTIRCLTGPYRPAFFTAQDDDTVGAIIAGSTGSPGGTYAAVALWIDDNVASLRHLRIAWADLAVYYDVDTGWPQELWHTQIAHCTYGVGGGCPEFRVYNALLDHVAINFYVAGAGAPVTARVEHLTSDSATWLNQSGDWLNLCLTNSLLVNVANPGAWTGAGNAVGTAADFNTVLAGRHYLAPGSAHRDAGTEAVDGRLRAELAGLTTEPPARWTEPVTAETVFEPWVARDADTPDRGYHYPPLDFLLSGLAVSGTSLTLTHGVAVGVYGTDGFLLQGDAQFASTGEPALPNRLVHYRVVQEDPAAEHGRVAGALLRDANATSAATARLRFTELVLPGGEGAHFNGGATLGALVLSDCELTGGRLDFSLPGTWTRTVALTNNVFDRVTFSLGTGSDPTLSVHARNNLFRGCPAVNLNAAPGTAWAWFDNLFDTTSLWQYFGGVANGYNAYHNCPRPLTPAGSGNLILTALSYTTDAWGRRWYALATPPLADAGSRPSWEAGLWHHTTRPDQVKEGASTVDLGFHHVAAGPAEAEIAVSGAALSASSTYNSQWIPAKARDGLLNDPGWHNAGASALGYQRPVEFLRADLGVSRPVGGVAYAPRVMSPSWTDGTWNGVYRRWEIYVTDSASSEPADWGVPVAAGEWYWPNRQERKEVRFSAKSGRYVIWRRVEAWGWYTRQAGQTWPGFANANEVGVYPPPPAALTPVDTDSDGLADWLEDANGDGLVGPNETDPYNPVSDPVSGLLDSVKKAPPPTVMQYSYRLTASRDYHASPRSGNTPDATVTMWWWAFRPGWRDTTGDYNEIYTPPIAPGTLLLGGREDRWQYLRPGTKSVWEVRQGGSGKTYGPPENIAYPPSDDIKVPKEVCNGLSLPAVHEAGWPLTYTRGAYTTSHLQAQAPSGWPKRIRSVVLSCQAFDKSDGATLHPTADGYELGEPQEQPGGTWIEPEEITVAGKPLYWENSTVMVQVDLNKPPPVVTPFVDNVTWYSYDHEVIPGLPFQVALTWSRHPSVSQPRDLQADFDAGAEILALDNDGRASPRDRDDVPCYMEFFLIPAKRAVFPGNWNGFDFTDPKYNLVESEADLRFLCAQTFANVKLVGEIKLNGVDVAGAAAHGKPAIVLSNKSCNGPVAMHEYGHTVGLPDRWDDVNMIMYGAGDGGSEVTVDDGEAFYSKRPTVWFDFWSP